ncbi:MAG: CocE/NonD family hydrolase [Actinomycetota bacterium]|nr:CocE/NonD family hydrolase [Actinomycetota bacterium]
MPSVNEPRSIVELDGGAVLLEHDVGLRTRDGLRLSCDVYRPAREGRYPALLEHIPYRKDDLDAGSDRATAIHFARQGFATVRLDVRGTGNSEGIAIDEYTAEEQRDGAETVAWIADQPWCTGNVGSWGVSYGGFACIQLAALQPPALKAIAPVYATDDRYTDDMHFSGGALCALELAHYPLRILAMNALPPLRRQGETSDAFQERWLERVDATPAWIVRWLQEQVDGPYWRNGSLRPDPERIRCPALIVAGWRDGYRTAMLRLASSITTEWQLLAGPWMHARPDHGIPGPPYPFMNELVGWFRRHLGEAGPAASDRPRTVFFLTEFDPPSQPPAEVSGTWLSSNRWPQERGALMTWFPTGDGGLTGTAPTSTRALTVPFGPAVGVTSGNWCPPPPGHGLPADQRPDDARSATFTSAPLADPVGVFGQPVVYLRVTHPGPSAIVSVKLSDVSPGGESQLVTSGVLNLSHRDGHSRPEPFAGTGEIALELQATGWRFRAGHRIRLAVANADWPTVWPLPTTEPIELSLDADGACRLELPGLPPDAEPVTVSGELMTDPGGTGWETRDEGSTWRIVTDSIAGTSGIEASDGWSARSTEEDASVAETRRYHAFVGEADPLSADVEGTATFRLEQPGHPVRSTARGRFTSTAEEFHYDVRLDVQASGRRVYRQRWRGSVPRTLC